MSRILSLHLIHAMHGLTSNICNINNRSSKITGKYSKSHSSKNYCRELLGRPCGRRAGHPQGPIPRCDDYTISLESKKKVPSLRGDREFSRTECHFRVSQHGPLNCLCYLSVLKFARPESADADPCELRSEDRGQIFLFICMRPTYTVILEFQLLEEPLVLAGLVPVNIGKVC